MIKLDKCDLFYIIGVIIGIIIGKFLL